MSKAIELLTALIDDNKIIRSFNLDKRYKNNKDYTPLDTDYLYLYKSNNNYYVSGFNSYKEEIGNLLVDVIKNPDNWEITDFIESDYPWKCTFNL